MSLQAFYSVSLITNLAPPLILFFLFFFIPGGISSAATQEGDPAAKPPYKASLEHDLVKYYYDSDCSFSPLFQEAL